MAAKATAIRATSTKASESQPPVIESEPSTSVASPPFSESAMPAPFAEPASFAAEALRLDELESEPDNDPDDKPEDDRLEDERLDDDKPEAPGPEDGWLDGESSPESDPFPAPPSR